MSERLGPRVENAVPVEGEAFTFNPSIEIFPTPTIGERVVKLYGGKNVKVSITSSADQEIEDTLSLASFLASNGIDVVPHIAAREVSDENHLYRISRSLIDSKVDELFLIRGEGAPIGQFKTSAQIIKSLGNIGVKFDAIGIGGYPEGIEGMTEEELRKAISVRKELSERAGSKLHVVTQMCFDVEKTVSYLENIHREFGVPVTIGLPVTEPNSKLYEIAVRCGVGLSKETLLQNPDQEYSPVDFARKVAVESFNNPPEGFHIYTFNKLLKARSLSSQG